MGVQAGDYLIYVAEAGSDQVVGFEARSNIRRTLLITAGGKALTAARSAIEREQYLRRRGPEEADLVDLFAQEYAKIKKTRIATMLAARAVTMAEPPPTAMTASARHSASLAAAASTEGSGLCPRTLENTPVAHTMAIQCAPGMKSATGTPALSGGPPSSPVVLITPPMRIPAPTGQ